MRRRRSRLLVYLSSFYTPFFTTTFNAHLPIPSVFCLSYHSFRHGAYLTLTMCTYTCVVYVGKPVFIRHRTSDEIAREKAVPMSLLKDPQEDSARVVDPKWWVELGVR